MEKLEKNIVVLEQSTNTHKLKADNVIVTKLDNEDTLQLKINGKGIVTHGEHGTIVTESENVIKYVQNEVNPITKKIQKAFD